MLKYPGGSSCASGAVLNEDRAVFTHIEIINEYNGINKLVHPSKCL